MTSMENEISDARDQIANALGYIVTPKDMSLRELIREMSTELESEADSDKFSCVDHDCDDCHALKMAMSSWD